jgi:hypothetical protein
MELAVDGSQPSAIHMRVVLRGTDVGVAQQFLDRPQVCSPFQQMRGEAVPECMRVCAQLRAYDAV